ncbi:hypothetical protein LQ953_13315 [Sphingomonas sp. IC-56]|uniref:hypothetical protein n=1 Tax=Sphingomonas sp. IC-56 TaxID=2898529 RepID=UPI001E57613E|nr:hypothetical protein [Sphingomonas sp. IC-56]MCD2324997.1 hypothetical protein [Sphingomonas sp. IC-56]
MLYEQPRGACRSWSLNTRLAGAAKVGKPALQLVNLALKTVDRSTLLAYSSEDAPLSGCISDGHGVAYRFSFSGCNA